MPRPDRRAPAARPPSPVAQASRFSLPRKTERFAFRLRRMDPIRVAVRRGGVVEAIHRVHGVAVQDGAVIAEAGDSGLVAFMRSSSKPLQALPLARARHDLDARDLALASA